MQINNREESFRSLIERQMDLLRPVIHRDDYSCTISPEGEIHYIPYHGHSSFAKRMKSTVDQLVLNGWIFISMDREFLRAIMLPNDSQDTYTRFYEWVKTLPEEILSDKAPVQIASHRLGQKAVEWKPVLPKPTLADLIEYWI